MQSVTSAVRLRPGLFLPKKENLMVKKLFGFGCLLFALGVAAKPAPAADLFPCSCSLCKSVPSGMVCRNNQSPYFPTCATYVSTFCT
jgi:hypothetical protein